MSPPPLLVCHGISKRFGGAQALNSVDFDLKAGEVHGLVGVNGAGKSTLMKVLAGVVNDFDGRMELAGEAVRFAGPEDALKRGIAMVYQELSGIGQLSVAENLFLGRQPLHRLGGVAWREMRTQAKRALKELDIEIDVSRRLDRYPLVIRQMVEIARGVHSGARVLVLDEPTSSLSPPEAKRLFELIRQLKSSGVAIVFISHFIEDVLQVCDRVTILKNGTKLETRDCGEVDKHYVISRMLGRELQAELGEEAVELPQRTTKPHSLTAQGLTRAGEFADVTLAASPGEWLSIYGFQGAGHFELVQTLAGALPRHGGSVALFGKTLPSGDVPAAKAQGLVFVGADRAQTLVHRAPIYENVSMAHLGRKAYAWLTRHSEIGAARQMLERVGCQPNNPFLLAGSLSGGNQQKVVLAKWLLGPIKVLILEEPTRGMDVGAKAEVLRLVRGLQAEGTTVILATTEPELALSHADRILVMSRGSITHEFSNCRVDAATLTKYA